MTRLLVLAVLALGSRAYADRAAADKLAAEAQHDPAKLEACGRAYLEVYNEDPGRRGNDEVLAAGAACFHGAHAVSAELQLYTILIKYYPVSKLAPAALRASAAAYASVAYYDRAAAMLEEYAMKYAGEHDADQALTEAIALRAALGDTARQVEDTHRFTKLFGAKQRAVAAAAELALADVLAPDEAIAQLRGYLAQFARVDPELTGLAHARLGALLWARSCPVHPIDGLCIQLVRPRAEHCSDPELLEIVAVARTADARQALVEEREALAASAHHAAAMAALALADAELEKMLAARFPSDLDFDRRPSRRATRDRSTRAFTAWVDAGAKLSTTVSEQYRRVVDLKDAEASVAAAARLGQTVAAFRRALLVGAIPRDTQRGEFVADKKRAYCSELRMVAEPLAERATELYRACLIKSIELDGGFAWADLCEREGHAIAPKQFPIGHELVGPPLPGASIATEPALP